MKTVQDALNSYKDALKELHDPLEAEAIGRASITEITGLSSAQQRAFTDRLLKKDDAEGLKTVLGKLKTAMPLQYAVGYTEFFGLKFKVNPSVLIPRPETEELVKWVIDICGKEGDQHILDIGTGSGCIAVSLKYALHYAKVSAIDISKAALATAAENAVENKAVINFMEADILKITRRNFPQKLSVIVSNPPYVTQADKALMHRNVVNFEPHNALFVPEDDPLLFYRAIADFAQHNLVKRGQLFLEINESLHKETVELLQLKGFIDIELRKDLRGKNRMIRATFDA